MTLSTVERLRREIRLVEDRTVHSWVQITLADAKAALALYEAAKSGDPVKVAAAVKAMEKE